MLKNNNPVLISTIGKEWLLGGKFNRKAKIFLDIQGYVRDLKHFGKKTFFKSPFLEDISCLKGTVEEINHLPKEIIKKQRSKCLIITKGNEGLILYYKGNKSLLRPNKKIQRKDTLGAGDTFFAYFVDQFLKINNAFKSAQYAINKTSEFLSSKVN